VCIRPRDESPELKKSKCWGWGYNFVAECLPSMLEALGLIPRTGGGGRNKVLNLV
jgi:hypothetical protein